MPQPGNVRKPPRVVFSLGVPMPTERRASKAARRLKITRNAFIVAAIEEKLAREGQRDENASEDAAA